MATVKISLAVPQHSANKVSRTSKVQQIATMFDAKLCQSAGHNLAEAELLQTSSHLMPTYHPDGSNLYQEVSPISAHQDFNTFFVPEDEFVKLPVKHKVRLYEQFIEGKFKENITIGNQAEKYMETSRIMAEVPNDDEQFEFIEQPSETGVYKDTITDSLSGRQTENEDDFKAAVQREPSRKRRNDKRRHYSPPRKVRCSRDKGTLKKIFRQSVKLVNSFATWLSEKKQKVKETWSTAIKNSTKQQLYPSEGGEIFDSSFSPELETGNYTPFRFINYSTSNNEAANQFESLLPQIIPKAETSTSKESGSHSFSSTPISGQQPIHLTNRSSHQTLHSPSSMPVKRRRKQNTFNNPDILNMAIGDHTGQFWIKCSNFNLSFDIFCRDFDQVRDAYNIFRQKCWGTNDLCFGIANVPFCINQEVENLSKLLPHKKRYTCYWFSTPDIIVTFAGKRISQDKVQETFQFLKTSTEDGGVISFGVGNMEFSSVRQFSMDNSYSVLAGLQSGNSNDLEGLRENDLTQSEEGNSSILKSMEISSTYSIESSNHFFSEEYKECPLPPASDSEEDSIEIDSQRDISCDDQMLSREPTNIS